MSAAESCYAAAAAALAAPAAAAAAAAAPALADPAGLASVWRRCDPTSPHLTSPDLTSTRIAHNPFLRNSWEFVPKSSQNLPK